LSQQRSAARPPAPEEGRARNRRAGAAGAIIGPTGGGKGAAIGWRSAAAPERSSSFDTREEIHLQRGALVELRLTSPVTVRVAGKNLKSQEVSSLKSQVSNMNLKSAL
jgi:hypothetical protein